MIASLNNLISIYLDQGRLEGSKKLAPQVLKIGRRELGDENCHTLDSIANLSSTYEKEEKLKEAEDLRGAGGEFKEEGTKRR